MNILVLGNGFDLAHDLPTSYRAFLDFTKAYEKYKDVCMAGESVKEEWEKADEFFEQALNQNAEDAQAYLGKLMAELKVSKQENLIECKEPFENMN